MQPRRHLRASLVEGLVAIQTKADRNDTVLVDLDYNTGCTPVPKGYVSIAGPFTRVSQLDLRV